VIVIPALCPAFLTFAGKAAVESKADADFMHVLFSTGSRQVLGELPSPANVMKFSTFWNFIRKVSPAVRIPDS